MLSWIRTPHLRSETVGTLNLPVGCVPGCKAKHFLVVQYACALGIWRASHPSGPKGIPNRPIQVSEVPEESSSERQRLSIAQCSFQTTLKGLEIFKYVRFLQLQCILLHCLALWPTVLGQIGCNPEAALILGVSRLEVLKLSCRRSQKSRMCPRVMAHDRGCPVGMLRLPRCGAVDVNLSTV